MIIPDTRVLTNPLIDYSFPSGHSTSSFAIAVVFSLHSIILAMVVLPIAAVVSISRMYLGLHYPTDCAVGVLIGTITSFIVVNFFSASIIFNI